MKRFISRIIHWLCLKRYQLIYSLGGKIVGARALVFQKDQVLLARHTYLEGWYTLGGMVDRLETPLNAIKRELVEEAGVIVTEDPILLGIYRNNFQGKDDYVYLYIVKSFTRVESHSPEIEECRFFPVSELPTDVSNATKRRIQESLGLEPISETW